MKEVWIEFGEDSTIIRYDDISIMKTMKHRYVDSHSGGVEDWYVLFIMKDKTEYRVCSCESRKQAVQVLGKIKKALVEALTNHEAAFLTVVDSTLEIVQESEEK